MHDITFVLETLLFGGGMICLIALATRLNQALAPTPPRNAVVAHPPAQPAFQPRADLERRTVAELQQLARAQGITGLSRLRKAELIDQLLAVSGPG